MKGWLDKYNDGGPVQENYNDYSVSAGPGFEGDGYSNVGRNYSPAWGGQFQMGGQAPKRRGVRYNEDDSVSTHLMKTETDGKGNWFSFPTLFQNSIPYADDSENWLDMSDRPWEEAYEEAKKRGEVINFGSDKDAAIKFGQGSWKDKKQMGGSVYPVNYVPQAAMGGSIPGTPGFTYARTNDPAPSEGPYAKKTMASAQNGMRVLQRGEKFMNNNTSSFNFTEAQKRIKEALGKKKKVKKDYKINLRETNKVANDAIPTPKKLITTDLNELNVRNKTKAEIAAEEEAYNKAVAAERRAVREKADANPLNKGLGFFDSENQTRQNWEDSTAGLESKFRVSDEPNFFDDWINPLNMIGGMASDLGAAPNQIVQQDSMMPLITAVGVPLLTGGLEGLGAKSNKQFVNNLINPFNTIPGYHSVEKAVGKKLGMKD